MLNRVYIDNFRCFVNFELRLDQQQLILGLNGSGKSTLLEVLRALKALLAGNSTPESLFPASTRTRWETRSRQTFELDVDLGPGAMYQFKLELDSWGSPSKTKVRREFVSVGGRPIFEFLEGKVHLFNDNFEHKVEYPFDWFRSALATIEPRSENAKLTSFKRWIENLHCLQLSPQLIIGRSEHEETELGSNMSNFASWYRNISQENANSTSKLQAHLCQVIAGLESLDLRAVGASFRALMLRFSSSDQSSSATGFEIAFGELSDGQRALICLYSLIAFIVDGNACLFLDEPENYIGLPEIQPWLMELRGRMDESGGQVILISHHPEIINYLAPDSGLIFARDGSGPVRVRRYQSDQPLQPAELMARGNRRRYGISRSASETARTRAFLARMKIRGFLPEFRRMPGDE